MPRSAGFRFFVVGLLTLLMCVPLLLAGIVVDARSDYARQSVREVSRDMGGPQVLGAPLLVLPVEGPVTRTQRRETTDPATGETRATTVEVVEIARKSPVYLAPREFDVSLTTRSEVRKRGIFEVPVYRGLAEVQFDYDLDRPSIAPDETILWDQAQIILSLSDNRALRGDAALISGGRSIALEPRSARSGIFANVGDPRDAGTYQLQLAFNGAQRLAVAPAGRTTRVTMDSDWPHPSFDGDFLPDQSEVSEDGFTAAWTIPHLSRNLPVQSRENFEDRAGSFGVRFYQPNDFYQKAFRATSYGVLFIALTFLTVFLIEPRDQRPVHPVQYVFIGLAQSIFVLLMVSYAEQIGFSAAYIVASVATIAVIMLLALTGMKLGRRAWVLGAALVVIYAILYLILHSTDYALLAGSTLCFAALAGTIWATRNEKWHSDRPGLFSRRVPPAVPQPGA